LAGKIGASINAYKAYIPFMSDSFTRLPSSIIPEGLDSFSYSAYLPDGLERITLEKIFICGGEYTISVDKSGYPVCKNGECIKKGSADGSRVYIA
jgi:hypothetical protein